MCYLSTILLRDQCSDFTFSGGDRSIYSALETSSYPQTILLIAYLLYRIVILQPLILPCLDRNDRRADDVPSLNLQTYSMFSMTMGCLEGIIKASSGGTVRDGW